MWKNRTPDRGAAALKGLLWAAAALLFAAAPGSAAEAPSQPAQALVVFAAASLTDALAEVGRAFTASTQVPVLPSFAASSVLAKQIEAGAPAEVFVSADSDWMDYLEKRGLLRAATRHDLLGNRLVLIAPRTSPARVVLAAHVDLTAALGGGRLATGDPDSVPVGRYAQAALTHLGIWEQVAPRLVRAENVRSALEYVARGEATLGIVYRTDALAEKRVRVVDVFPPGSHPPIIYPVALTSGAGARAAAFELLPLRTSRSGSR
jgi:molybdate transport system substrate-binding protein